MYQVSSMKRLAGPVEHLRLEWKLLSAKNHVRSYNGFRFQVDGHPCMLWVNATDKAPALSEGMLIDIVVSDGTLVDRSGSNAVYALSIAADHAILVCHTNMSFFRGGPRISSNIYANFKDARKAIRTGLLLAVVVFFGLSLWQYGTERLISVALMLAPVALILEGSLDLYDYRWRSSWPSPTQRLTLDLYAMLDAGSPLHPAAHVYPI